MSGKWDIYFNSRKILSQRIFTLSIQKKYHKLHTLSYLFFLPIAWFLDINGVEFLVIFLKQFEILFYIYCSKTHV